MGVLIGFLFGYVAGANAGPEGYERLREAWQSISESREFQGLIATATAFVQNALSQGGAAVTEYLESAGAANGHPADPLRVLGGTEDLTKAIRAIAESEAVQELLSGGAAMLGGILERGGVAARE